MPLWEIDTVFISERIPRSRLENSSNWIWNWDEKGLNNALPEEYENIYHTTRNHISDEDN